MKAACISGAWRLGPDGDPGWFDLHSVDIQPAQWILATVFRLHWSPSTFQQEGIHNCLHAVTIGRENRANKIHLENIAQILGNELHITCRLQDSSGRLHRHTVALPEPKENYNNRWMLLIYTGHGSAQDPAQVKTRNVLYDCESLELLQNLSCSTTLACAQDVLFGGWQNDSVICDHEQNYQPRDHVMIHGNTRDPVSSQFELARVWGSLGSTLDALDPVMVYNLSKSDVADRIGHIDAWYNCSSINSIDFEQTRFARCTGHYRQTNSLGFGLHTGSINT